MFSAAAAQAQSSGGQKMTATIPFDFTAGTTSFPAGTYDFIRSGNGLYTIRNAEGYSQMILSSATVEPNFIPEKSNLKFVAVEGRHVLVQIWSDVAAIGNEFPNGATSLEIAKRPADVTITNGR
jgi:hypothetical protein